MNRLSAVFLLLPTLWSAAISTGTAAGQSIAARPGADGSIVVRLPESGVYKLDLKARAAAGVPGRNIVLKSAYGECLLTAPAGKEWGTVTDYAAGGSFCDQVEVKVRRKGVELGEATLTKVKELHLPQQSYVAVAQPNADTVSEINPPTFRWPALPGASTYTVIYKPVAAEWSRAVSTTITRNDDLQNLFFRPSRSLEPGDWEWKLQVNGRDRSGPIRFTVSPLAVKWELPPWQEFYRSFATARPRLLFSAHDLERMKANLAGPMKPYGDLLIADLEKQLGRPLFPVAKPGEEQVKGINDLMTVFAITRPIPEYLVLGRLLNRADFSAEAKRRTLALLEHYSGRKIAFDQDFANGLIEQSLAFTYDYLYAELTPKERAAIRADIVERLKSTRYLNSLPRFLFDAHAWQLTMHQSVSAAMAIWDEDSYARDFLHFSLPFYAALYPWFGGGDGGSAECAHYGMETDLLSSQVIRRLWLNFCGFDLANNPWYRNSLWFTLYSYPNNVKSSWFGDNSPDAKASLGNPAPVFTALYQKMCPNPYAAEFTARYLDINHLDLGKLARGYQLRLLLLCDGPFDRQSDKKLPSLPLARVFRDTGLVIANTDMNRADDNITLEFRSSPYGAYAHAHADQNSFNMMVHGDNLVVDAGYYVGWHDAHHYNYTIQTGAHNTLLIDGQGQPANSSYGWGRISAFSQGKDYVWMRGDAAAAYLNPALDRFDRGILFLRQSDRAVAVIFDELKAAAPGKHHYSWLLHLTAKPEIDAAKQQVNAIREHSSIQVNWLQPEPLKFSVSDSFDPKPVIWEYRKTHFHDLPPQYHLTAAHNGGQEANFVTVIQTGARAAAGSFASPVRSGDTVTVGDLQISRSRGRITVKKAGKVIAEIAENEQQPNAADLSAPQPTSRPPVAAAPLLPPFQDGETVCFAGDSITHSGGYIKVLADYYRSRYPGRKIRLINCGVGGDCIPGLLARLDADVLTHRPDRLFVMLGMNDMNRRLYGKDKTDDSYRQRRQVTRDRFVRNLEQLLTRLQKSGVKNIVIMSPTIYDQYASGRPEQENNLGADQSLTDFTALVADAAQRHGLPFIDQHSPMLAVTLAGQRRNPSFTLLRPDRIHPATPGDYQITERILAAQGQTASFPEAAVDAAALKGNNPVFALRRTSDGLEFQLKFNAMPMYLNPETMKVPEMATFYGRLNRAGLQISGLKPGRYAFAVNGAVVLTATAEEFARGFDLSTLPTPNPWFETSLKIAGLNQKITQLEAGKLRNPMVGAKMVRLARLKKPDLPADDVAAARILLKEKNNDYSAANYRRLVEDGTPEVRERAIAEINRLNEEIGRFSQPPVLQCTLRKIP